MALIDLTLAQISESSPPGVLATIPIKVNPDHLQLVTPSDIEGTGGRIVLQGEILHVVETPTQIAGLVT